MAASNPSPVLVVPEIFLRPTGQGRKALSFRRGQFIFRQGDVPDGIYFIVSGRVRLSVTSFDGKEATFAILGPRELFGEHCILSGQQKRVMTARAASGCEVVQVELKRVLSLLQRDVAFATFVLAQVISRVAHYEQLLVGHIMNNTERRLVSALLRLSDYDGRSAKPKIIEGVSQEVLAEIVGSSRPRVSGFMNKFRRLGYLDYGGNRIVVKPSLVSILFQPNHAPRARRTENSK